MVKIETAGMYYTQQEMDAARIEAFNAARETVPNPILTLDSKYKHLTAADYLPTLSMSKEPASAPADKAEGEKRDKIRNPYDKEEDVKARLKFEGRRFRSAPEGEKDWEVVKYKNEKLGVHDPVTIRHFDCVTKKCAIHSVRRTSDSQIFTVGDKVEIYYEGAKSMLKGLRQITGFKIMEGMVVLHSSGDSALNEIQKPSPSSTPEQIPLLPMDEKQSGCGVCGTTLVMIRGRYPNTDKRAVCPTCATERLEQIHEMSDKNYGQAYKSKQQ